MKKLQLLVLAVCAALTLSACDRTPEYDNVVYVTLYPMQYLVEEIAGDTVHVEYVPGGGSHGSSFDPSGKEIISMLDSDLLFYVNGGADSYIEASESLFDGGNVELIDMSKHITYNEICLTHSHDDHDHEEDATHGDENEEDVHQDEDCDENNLSPDPHFWLDPARMIQAAEYVKTKLISTYPNNHVLYENNWTVLNKSLEKLDDDFQLMADSAVRPIITTVRLFSYWEEHYGIEIFSITNDVHSSEGTVGDYTELIHEAEYHKIMYVGFEKNANSPEGDVFLTSLKDEYISLEWDLPEQLFLHGLGKITTEEIENGSNYISIMYENLEALNTMVK